MSIGNIMKLKGGWFECLKDENAAIGGQIAAWGIS